MSTEWAVEAHQLRKEFGRKTAVADLTLRVGRGEVFGFLGPNGAGKTTSVKMLMGLTAPTSGSGMLLGRPLGDRLARARVGFLPEHFRFHEWLRAEEFLDLHGRLYGMDRAGRRAVIPDLLELVGLADRAGTRLAAFSKGMLQRIGLAQALLNDPDLVFLDEPTSGLDPLGRRLVRQVISRLRERGTAVFLNSHLLGEVEKTCDRVAFIRQGIILQTAHVSDFEADRLHVRLRVGQPTGQLLADLEQFDDGVTLDALDGRITLCLAGEAEVAKLARWLVDQGYALYELTPQRQSLEERFLEVVGEDAGDA